MKTEQVGHRLQNFPNFPTPWGSVTRLGSQARFPNSYAWFPALGLSPGHFWKCPPLPLFSSKSHLLQEQALVHWLLSPFLLVLLVSTGKSAWPSLNPSSWIWGITGLNCLRWQILCARLYLLPPTSRLGAPRGRDRDGFPSISPLLVTESCQRYNELHLGPPHTTPKPRWTPGSNQCTHPENRRWLRPVVQRPAASVRWGLGNTTAPPAGASCQEGPPKRPQSPRLEAPPSPAACARRRAPGGGLFAGNARWAQGPGSRIQGSDVIQDPGSLCGSREWGW